uniref:Uncharacterized protein n=1 Tax=Panagrolaimus sp. JU765 TaxID=591449 RepID=A0AC34Q0M4_9BILA
MYNETKLQDELAYMDEQMKNVKQKQYDWEKALNPFAKMDAILTMVQDIVDIKNKFINISDQCLNLYTFPMTNQS